MSNKIDQLGGGPIIRISSLQDIKSFNTDNLKLKKILKVVLTGGPSAGKSTVLPFIKKYFNTMYPFNRIRVITLNELATNLIDQGISYNPKNRPLFQKCIMKGQKDMEDLIDMYIDGIKEQYDKIIVLLDRGFMDSKAYLFEDNRITPAINQRWERLIRDTTGLTEAEWLIRYDIIIHITSGAVGGIAPPPIILPTGSSKRVHNDGFGFFYTTDNNPARTETPEGAYEMDKKTLYVWSNTTKPVYYIDNANGIVCPQGKGNLIIQMICKALGFNYLQIFTSNYERDTDLRDFD